MLTVTWLVTSIVGLAYAGLFALMGVGASDEIATIEKLKELKAGGTQITNTVADLDASIAENELAIVVFFTGAALTLVLTVPALVLAILWWLPPTTRAMIARRRSRAAVPHGPVPQTSYGAYR